MSERDILLQRGTPYYTHSAMDAFRVARGCVTVCVVPLNRDGRMGLALRVARIDAGHVIPALCWKDSDQRQWRFALQTEDADGAELTMIPHGATTPLKRRFIEGMGLDTWEAEGYEASLTELYRQQELKNRVFVARSDRQTREARIQEQKLVRTALRSRIPPGQLGDDPLYRVTGWACLHGGIDLAPQDRLEQACEEMSVPEMARVSHFICRRVVLEGDWYRHDCGILISMMDGKPVACVPHGSGYRFFLADMAGAMKLNRTLAGRVEPVAWAIGRALPMKAIGREELRSFVYGSFRPGELAVLGAWGVFAALACLLTPRLSQQAFDVYLPMGQADTVVHFGAAAACFMLGFVLLLLARGLLLHRMAFRAGVQLQAAACQRLFELPERFLRSRASTDLAGSLMDLGPLARQRAELLLTLWLTVCTSLVCLIQMIFFSPALTLTGVLLLAIVCPVMLLCSRLADHIRAAGHREKGEAIDKLSQLLTGVKQIRMAGAEERAMLEYMLPTAREKQLTLQGGRMEAISLVLQGSLGTLSALALFTVGAHMDLNPGVFVAFLTLFGSLSGAVTGLMKSLMVWHRSRPELERVLSVLQQEPEGASARDVVTDLTGDITLQHVTFTYDRDRHSVLQDLSLHIAPGEYVAVVGPSGCGKSTLLKLLLGFEFPQSGRVCYDGRDISRLDKQSLRRRLGVVLQDGRLISGSIRDNITVASPGTSQEALRQIIADVGLEKDIDEMPMGLDTLLTEGGDTISGGQMQRILLARALCGDPSVLLLDEATSALDNMTQQLVCRSLQRRGVTRLVIAHRLSTVKDCDRILVLDQGRLVEEGNYDTLMRKNGLFRQMAERQLCE